MTCIFWTDLIGTRTECASDAVAAPVWTGWNAVSLPSGQAAGSFLRNGYGTQSSPTRPYYEPSPFNENLDFIYINAIDWSEQHINTLGFGSTSSSLAHTLDNAKYNLTGGGMGGFNMLTHCVVRMNNVGAWGVLAVDYNDNSLHLIRSGSDMQVATNTYPTGDMWYSSTFSINNDSNWIVAYINYKNSDGYSVADVNIASASGTSTIGTTIGNIGYIKSFSDGTTLFDYEYADGIDLYCNHAYSSSTSFSLSTNISAQLPGDYYRYQGGAGCFAMLTYNSDILVTTNYGGTWSTLAGSLSTVVNSAKTNGYPYFLNELGCYIYYPSTSEIKKYNWAGTLTDTISIDAAQTADYIGVNSTGNIALIAKTDSVGIYANYYQ